MNLKKERPTTQSRIMDCEQSNWRVHLSSAGPFLPLALNDLLTHLTIPRAARTTSYIWCRRDSAFIPGHR